MKKDKLYQIFSKDNCDWDGCNITQGLIILNKYTNEDKIKHVDKYTIYSLSVERVLELNISKKDLKKLRDLNWMISDGALACFI